MPRLRWLVLTWALFGIGCGSETTGAPDGPGKPDGAPKQEARPPDAPAPDQGAKKDALQPDTGCVPTYKDCTGICGPVLEKCSGKIMSCGGCPSGEVCNVDTHLCGKPLITCGDLKATCGLIKNSCGKPIDCGTCPVGQECDPDTNTCRACSNVTCQDLGYECGKAWLGCGPSSTTTDCGTCPTGKKCNLSYNVCEPDCAPKSPTEICTAAKAASGVECGYISNGCGGIVDCGTCPAGKGCGIYGVANRCEPILFPDECIVLGKNCGKLQSACGGQVDCGTCPSGQVCNANGVCGPPCQPKTCADFVPAECGVFNDGCNGSLTCACKQSGAVCVPGTGGAPAKCCVNTASCPAGSCSTTVKNTCTGANINCNTCTSAQVCDTASKTCVAKKTCASYSAGGTAPKCNDNAFYDNGAGQKFACPCQSPDWFCINDSATVEGSCCKNVNPGCPSSGPGSCNSSVVNSCTGAVTPCTCPPNYHCDGDTCVPNDTCAKFSANGNAGDPCSNGPSPSFPNGAGQNLTCLCKSGLACVDGAGQLVTGGTVGTCVVKKKCSDYTANGNAGEDCSNGPSPQFPDGAGTDLSCPCKAGYACANAQNVVVSGGDTGVCKLKKTCADYSATGVVGSPCNPNKFFSDGFGGTFACPCTISGGFGNNTCVGATPTTQGTCQCAPTACTCTYSGLTNGCGGTLSCPCPANQQCNKTTHTCCQVYTCGSLPPGIPAGACGTIANSCLQTTFTCACDTTSKPNNKCVLQSGQTWGSCVCTPKTCAETGKGVWPDGCGGTLNCAG